MVSIESTAYEFAQKLAKIPEQQQFAAAVALTRTAKRVQVVAQAEVARKMNLKNPWTQKGIRITPATKEKLEAEVYSKDWYMPQQEGGAKRTAKSGKYYIPGDDFKNITGIDPKRQVIPRNLRHDKIGVRRIGPAGAVPFLIRSRKGGAQLLAVRTGRTATIKGPDGRLRAPIGILYLVVNRPVNIRARHFFFDPSVKEYDRVIADEYFKAYDEFVKL